MPQLTVRCLPLVWTHLRRGPSGRLSAPERGPEFLNPHVSSPFVHLRALAPSRALTVAESYHLASRQARRLLVHLGVVDPPVATSRLISIPRLEVVTRPDLPVSAFAKWIGTHWLVGLNSTEPVTRRRFSLAHEIKHIVDSPIEGDIYEHLSHRDRERIADYFAACLLMPWEWVMSRAGANQDIRGLAKSFGVSQLAMRVRLASHVAAGKSAPLAD